MRLVYKKNIGGLEIGGWTIFRQIRQSLHPPKFPSIRYVNFYRFIFMYKHKLVFYGFNIMA